MHKLTEVESLQGRINGMSRDSAQLEERVRLQQKFGFPTGTNALNAAMILAIMALTTLGFAAACYAVGRFRLSRVLEMLPFPVVCGFMASVGWLLMDAGFEVAADVGLSVSVTVIVPVTFVAGSPSV